MSGTELGPQGNDCIQLGSANLPIQGLKTGLYILESERRLQETESRFYLLEKGI